MSNTNRTRRQVFVFVLTTILLIALFFFLNKNYLLSEPMDLSPYSESRPTTIAEMQEQARIAAKNMPTTCHVLFNGLRVETPKGLTRSECAHFSKQYYEANHVALGELSKTPLFGILKGQQDRLDTLERHGATLCRGGFFFRPEC